jgi:hypothetical protein
VIPDPGYSSFLTYHVGSPSSGSGPSIAAGWHTLVRVWDGQQVRQYVDGLRTNTVAATASGGWTIYEWGCQFSGSQALAQVYVLPFAPSAPPRTTPWSPAEAPARSGCCGRRWMRPS